MFSNYIYPIFHLYSTNKILLCSRNRYISFFFFSTEGREGLDAALLTDGGAPGKVEGVDGLHQAGGRLHEDHHPGPAETRAGGGVRGKR